MVDTSAVLTSDWLVGSCGGCVRTAAWRASLTRASAWGCRPTPTGASPTSRTGTMRRSRCGTTTTSTSSTRYILDTRAENGSGKYAQCTKVRNHGERPYHQNPIYQNPPTIHHPSLLTFPLGIQLVDSVINVKVIVAAFNQEKALVDRGLLHDYEPSCGPHQPLYHICCQARSDHPVWVTNDLSLNVMWADIPLVTDGALVDVAKQDDTLSMKWNMVCHDTVCP